MAMKCHEQEDVVRCLREATRSAFPVTLDLNQKTLAQPEHLAALLDLCTSAAAHVTLTNGLIVLDGEEGVMIITCSNLTFQGMEIVRFVTTTPPRPPKRGRAQSQGSLNRPVLSSELPQIGSMLFIHAPDDTGHAPHVDLEECMLRMEGDPRYNMAPAVFVKGGRFQLRMDKCKLLNMHPALQVMSGAQVELHDCHADMVFGMQTQLVVYDTGSKLSLHGCTLVEEEGPCLPPASSIPRQPTIPSIGAGEQAALELHHTTLRMPLGPQLGRFPYAILGVNSRITATDSTFDRTFTQMIIPAPASRFTRCTFRGFHPHSIPASFIPASMCGAFAMVGCTAPSGGVVEDCTFTDALDRSALDCSVMPLAVPPPGGAPTVHIKGCKIANCLHGIQMPVHAMLGQFQPANPSVRMPVEVEDTTITVTTSPLACDRQMQTCVWLEGPAVSATLHRCVIQALGEETRGVFISNGTRLAMTDCTVTQHGFGDAMMLGHAPVEATIERTTITSDVPDGSAREAAAYQAVVATRDAAAKFIDCKIQGSASHRGVIGMGAGKTELVRCAIAPDGHMREPWFLADPSGRVKKAMIVLKYCSVGECSQAASIHDRTIHVLDNTPYIWSDELPPHTQPPGTRQLLFGLGRDRSVGTLKKFSLKYINDEASGSRGPHDEAKGGTHGPHDQASGSCGPHDETKRSGGPHDDESEPATAAAAATAAGATAAGSGAAAGATAAGSGAVAAGTTGAAGGTVVAAGTSAVAGAAAVADASGSGIAAGSGAEGKADQQQPLVAPGGFWWPSECMCCGTSEALSWCQGCRCVRFCSVMCQKRSWDQHKPVCQYISQYYGQAKGGSKVSKGEKR